MLSVDNKMTHLVVICLLGLSITSASKNLEKRSAKILPPQVNAEPDESLVAGYPGWQQPAFNEAPNVAKGRLLYYRKNPKVEKYRSAVHELYMRPYNYVSYELGGERPTQYEYHYASQPAKAPHYPADSGPTVAAASTFFRPLVHHQNAIPEAYRPGPSYAEPATPHPHSTPRPYLTSSRPPVYHPTTPSPPIYHPPASPTPPPTYIHSTPTPPVYHHTHHSTPAPPPVYHPSSPSPSLYHPTSGYHPFGPSTPPTYPEKAFLDHHAVAVLSGEQVHGEIHFYQLGGPAAPVNVVGNITGLAPGLHGFHIHQLGDLSDGCKSFEGHFNPYQVTHGAPYDKYRHAGDLGNILADDGGVAMVDLTDRHLSLNGLNSVIGRGVVVHAVADDLGRGGDDGSLKTGNAGGRVACGVIGRASDVV